jgi:predicted amidohydrolase YtcJ
MLNSLALRRLDVDGDPSSGIERDGSGRPTGRLWRMDRWLADRLAAGGEPPADGAVDLAWLSRAALALGVTGWTDATPERTDSDTLSLAYAVDDGQIMQRLHLMLPAAAPAATVHALEHVPKVTVGPVKVLLDDVDLPTLDGLAASIAAAHACGRSVAVHCVTRVQAVLTVAALDVVGARAGDRIEHGAVIPAALMADLVRLGVTVVTQPNFIWERGDAYLADVAAADLPDLWRAGSLAASGVGLAVGSDAPFGSPDPWVAVRAATRRLTSSGRLLGPEEAVTSEEAVRWWSGSAEAPQRPRRVEVGAPGDLMILTAPLAEALSGEDPVTVAATVMGGTVVSRRG